MDCGSDIRICVSQQIMRIPELRRAPYYMPEIRQKFQAPARRIVNPRRCARKAEWAHPT
jgi:hypothetical protein